MRGAKRHMGKGITPETVSSRIKNPDLVRRKHRLIVRKSAKLFIKKGYEQTTMREISKATGMAIGNLYDYISKKEDILCLVFDVYHQNLKEHLEKRGVFSIEEPQEQLRSFVHHALQNMQKCRDEIVLIYRESRSLPRKYLKKAIEKELEHIRLVEKIIIKGNDRGVFHVQDPFLAADMIVHQLLIIVFRRWTFKGKYTDEQINYLIEEYLIKSVIH